MKVVCWDMLAAGGFDFAQVRQRAQQLAERPYEEPVNRIPQALQTLSYEQYRSIRFRPQNALWASERLPFQIDFFLPGLLHKQTVLINEVTPRRVRRLAFSPQMFLFGTNRLELPSELECAGFRILRPAGSFGEVGSFLGASYFRMAGQSHVFGTSARGLALNTVLLGKEEFPAFREFWIEKPKARASSLRLWALMDSPSAAGGFEFVITPGIATIAIVKAAFFPRRAVQEFGLAPLSSMFLYDENSHPALSDFRPEVHDADGLLMHTGQGTVLWRPLETGKMMRVNAYQDLSPKGFGLMQRDRDFEHYQDLVARFELRPSVWVKPLGQWGPGRVELIQLPTNIEYTDNVVAFWVPARPPAPGQALEVAYELHWLTNLVMSPTLGYIRATRVGRVDTGPGKRPNLRFVIDFAGKGIEGLTAREQLDAEVNYGEGTRLVADTVAKNPINQTWRLVIEMLEPTKAVDVQALLKRRGEAVTETWTYTWQP